MVHTGNGNLTADNCNSIVGDNSQIVMSDNLKDEITELVNKLSALKSQIEVDEIEFTDYLDDIKQELNKKMTSPKVRFIQGGSRPFISVEVGCWRGIG